MRSYNGRRTRRRGISPISLLLALLVVVLAAVLAVLTLRRDKQAELPKDVPPVSEPGEPAEPAVPNEPAEPVEPVQPAVKPIAVFGDQQRYEAVYRVGDTGYEMYTYVDSTAKKYAACVNQAADALAGTARVFTAPIPLSSGITLPDELYTLDVFSDQEEAEQSILGYMNGNVIPVPLYDALMQHRTEYVFYRSDHHWSGLGAYYAYAEYCKAAGLTPHALTDFKTADFTGFLGTFYRDSSQNEQMGANPDTVTAYFPLGDVTMKYTDQNGKTYEASSVIYDETNAPAGFKYGAYLYGDNAFTEITNADITDGSACLVVKESFGNAYVPFMVDHYQTTYVVDYRYWSGSITQFVREHNVQDVLFCNNLSAIRNNSLMGNLYGIL